MKTSFVSWATLAAGVSASIAPVKRASLQAITVQGNAFFQGGNRFYIRGVDYQPGGSSDLADPIADSDGCTRDIAEFKKLGLNAIRVYTVDNSANHDDCMNALAAAGIYLILDVNSPNYSINRATPAPSYNAVYLQNVFATIDAFAKYTNTLAFFSGNEVVNDGPSSAAAPYVKAVTRDMRQYISSRKYRAIPVGYSAADVNTNRLEMAEYMNCGSDAERSDFFAFNDYSWCDPSSFTKSGWDQKVKNFTGYGLPLFLSEYGCNTNTRDFGEVQALYSTEMTAVYSGGLVYEYSQEASNYGLVNLDGGSVQELPDFTTLAGVFKQTANPTGSGGFNQTGGASGCPTYNPPNWAVQDDTLPAMPDGAQQYLQKGAGTGPGLNGPGSQNAGGNTTLPAAGSASTSTGSSSQATHSSSKSSSAAYPLIIPEISFIWGPFITVALSTVLGAALLGDISPQ